LAQRPGVSGPGRAANQPSNVVALPVVSDPRADLGGGAKPKKKPRPIQR